MNRDRHQFVVEATQQRVAELERQVANLSREWLKEQRMSANQQARALDAEATLDQARGLLERLASTPAGRKNAWLAALRGEAATWLRAHPATATPGTPCVVDAEGNVSAARPEQ